MNTTVVNLLGGPGIGKSTTAAGIFYHMKLLGESCELVREYVKNWAWKNLEIRPYDQFYITGKQSQYESILYNKVKFIVTDSPVLLGAIYDEFYSGQNIFLSTLMNFLEIAQKNGIKHDYFLLQRNKPYHGDGRFQTEDESRKIDEMIESFMGKYGIPFEYVSLPDEQRPEFFLKKYGLQPEHKNVCVEVTSATVLITHGTDHVNLETTLPSGVYPFEGFAHAKIDVARNKGEEWVQKNLGFDPKVINTV